MQQSVHHIKFSQEATGTAWIGLEQNIIDSAVNEWRNTITL